MEQKKDGISRQSRGFGVPGRYRLLDPPPVALRFASAGGFWRTLDTSEVLVRARWLWWDRARRLDLDSTTPSVLSRGVVVAGAGPIGRDCCGCCIFWSGSVDMDVWARFHNVVGRGKGLRRFGGTRERSCDLRWRRARPCSGLS